MHGLSEELSSEGRVKRGDGLSEVNNEAGAHKWWRVKRGDGLSGGGLSEEILVIKRRLLAGTPKNGRVKRGDGLSGVGLGGEYCMSEEKKKTDKIT